MAANKETQTDPGREMLDTIAQLQRTGLGPLGWFGTAWVDALGGIGSELVAFVANRIQEDFRTQHALLHCSDPKELRRIQTEFMQKAIDDYTAETGRIAELGVEFWQSAVAEAKKS